MISFDLDSSRFLRVPPEKEHKEILENLVEDEPQENVLEPEEVIRCRQCRNVITSPDERIIIQGSHQHTFANPHGIVFEIGCFRNVKGCGYIGPSSNEFSWFSGFSWRVVVCVACLAHLGWLFDSPAKDSFHGLILNHLITR